MIQRIFAKVINRLKVRKSEASSKSLNSVSATETELLKVTAESHESKYDEPRNQYKKVQAAPNEPKTIFDDLKQFDQQLTSYYKIQIETSIPKSKGNAKFRYEFLIDLLANYVSSEIRSSMKVLCIGARNGFELDYFRNVGFGDVLGIDLFSVRDDIYVMDMHELSFSNDSFDVVYSCDSLEHAIEPQKAVDEVFRILKPNGYYLLSTPLNWRRSHKVYHSLPDEELVTVADCQDFKTEHEVLSMFSYPYRTIHLERKAYHADAHENMVGLFQKIV